MQYQEEIILTTAYGISLTGKSHLARGIPCQDAHAIVKLNNGWWIAAVADGVGSASHSQIGSYIAAYECVRYCEQNIPKSDNKEDILSVIKSAYAHAFYMIVKESENNGHPIYNYDTTLHTVIYNGDQLFYGHSGDGGIIGLDTSGEYVVITKPQKGSDYESVIPLRSGPDSWEFGYYSGLVSVAVITDGMLETICNYLLRKDGNDSVYVPLVTYFADPKGFTGIDAIDSQIIESIREFVDSPHNYNSEHFYSRLLDIYKHRINNDRTAEETIREIKSKDTPVRMMQGEQDDKTIVCLMNLDCDCKDQDPSFYGEVDWKAFQEKLYHSLYPHLFSDESKNSSKLNNTDDGAEQNDNNKKKVKMHKDNRKRLIKFKHTRHRRFIKSCHK